MIVLDANVLLYAYDSTSLHHRRAKEWVTEVFSGTEPVGIPRQTLLAFLRVVTNPRLPGERFTETEAVAVIDRWLEQPNVRLLGPLTQGRGEQYWSVLKNTVLEGQARGPLLADAELAALTISTGGVLYTTDQDFGRFPRLRWKNPLV